MFIGNFRPLSEGKEMVYKSIGKENVSVWGTENFKNLIKNFPKSLNGKSFILPGFNNPIRNDFEKFMLQHGLDFTVSMEAQDTALQKELAFMGEGLILFGEESLKNWPKAAGLRKIGTIPGLHEEYWLGMAKKEIDNQSIKAILAVF